MQNKSNRRLQKDLIDSSFLFPKLINLSGKALPYVLHSYFFPVKSRPH